MLNGNKKMNVKIKWHNIKKEFKFIEVEDE